MPPDDPDFSRPASSSAWPVLAIVALLAAAGLLVVSVALGGLLVVQQRRAEQGHAAASAAEDNEDGDGGPADGWREPDNPPYPVQQSLRPPGPPAVPGEAPAAKAGPTARDRFLALGRDVWAIPAGSFPASVTVAPDGRHVAYVERQHLFVRPLDAGETAAEPATPAAVVGAPAWSPDGRFVYFADREGDLRRLDVAGRHAETLPFHGDAPVPVPPDGRKLVFRRSRPAPKVDLPDGPANPDPREIVLGDLETHEVRVLLRDGAPTLTPRAVAPDGRQLALVAEPSPGEARLHLLDLAPGAAAGTRAVGPPCPGLQAVCWSADGKALLYGRGQRPAPPDCWEADAGGPWADQDLFRLDVGTRAETRLSRGGGFGPPGRGGDDLFFLAWDSQPGDARFRLRRAPLAAVLDFAAHEPDRPARDREAWTKLLDDALEKARVPPQAGGETLPPEVIQRLADAFATAYRQHFHAEPPADTAAWERQQRELRALALPEAVRPRFALVLGAVEGDYLRRRHGATWYMGAGALVPTAVPADRTDEDNPFGIILNPYRAVRDALGTKEDEDEEGGPWLRDALVRARGRALLLTNDPAAAKDALAELADPDLSRARRLYDEGKGDKDREAKADRLLLDLVGRPEHAKNEFLVLYVGKVLYEHGRSDALRRLVEPRVEAEPRDAHKYNLLGLALLPSDPAAAAKQFQNALRCDLGYAPGWLNLAQAYAAAHEPEAASQCLRHYLHGTPYGPFADDARQRLAALEAGQ